LFFRLNITSAPMVGFVLFSQIIVAAFFDCGIQLKFEHPTMYCFALVMVTLYGCWNLDYFRYILPPFCVSTELKRVHTIIYWLFIPSVWFVSPGLSYNSIFITLSL
jgi:hypothetical protein